MAHLPPLDPAHAVAGLAEAEAAARLARDGPNELPSAKPRSFAAIAFEVVREPMFLLLGGCAVLYLALGDVQEAAILALFVAVVVGITLWQERKTERALDALRDLSSPRALVIRDGRRRRVAGREVVEGDVLLLSEGDRVPADGVVLVSSYLALDESLLTGEAVPVRKRALGLDAGAVDGTGLPDAEPGGDDQPWVFSGAMVVRGHGLVAVRATGARTALGRIGNALATVGDERTPLQQETDRLVRKLSIVALATCTGVVLLHAVTRGGFVEGLLAGIALAMALLPEEFPVILTVFLALGAWRISARNVLTRRVPAVETLGTASVLCVDKTGTLTENRMTVARLVTAGGAARDVLAADDPLPEDFHTLVEFAVLASQRDPVDPMEKAIQVFGAASLAATEHLHADWALVREYPLEPTLLAMSQVWRARAGDGYAIAAKGAPEAIVDLCHAPPAEAAAIMARVHALSADGLRVLGVACARVSAEALPTGQHDFDFAFVGLVALVDPVREGVPAAVAECYAAGMRVIMITGDYAGTAASVARAIGLAHPERVLTGPEIARLDDAALAARLADTNVVARAVPEQKLRIVAALKATRQVVAMTGDGVNDAPALRAADIGIAMGGRGTDVAREAAALVVTDDDFASIVAAVCLGRRIFENLKKAVGYTIAVHVPIAGMSLLPVLFGWPLVLLPAHIAFLELIIDPACSVAFEAEPASRDIMRRPPRRRDESLFGRRALVRSVVEGASVLAVVVAVFLAARAEGYADEVVRALAFAMLVVGNLALIVSNRSRTRGFAATMTTRNAAFGWVSAGALACLATVLAVPFLREVFRFGMPPAAALGTCALAALALLFWLDAVKRLLPAGGEAPA